MKTNIQIFTSEVFGEIRTCQVNNQIMFVGKDVAIALGYAKSRNALATHVDKEDKKDALIQGPLGGGQKMTIINESGLYSLILSSKLPQAKAIRYAAILLDYADESGQEFDELLVERNRFGAIWLHFAVRFRGNRHKVLYINA
jgi:hypothetical protein